MADGQAPRPTRFNFDTVFMASGSGTATGRSRRTPPTSEARPRQGTMRSAA